MAQEKNSMEPETMYYPRDHTWVEMIGKDKTTQEIGLSEEILYSLDEIWVG